ncbi:MAG: CAP domain-containing protein [Pseudanabaena sp. Salubria-1]|nr:CAP domain-containing protein [Pseudanabaena sp. Salubria-1]
MKRVALPLSILFGVTLAVTTQSSAQSPNYTLQLKANSDKCLQKMNPDWENGNPIHLWDCGVDQNNESWVYNAQTGQIRAKANPDKCIQKMNPDWENGNPIHLWDCGIDTNNESWIYNAQTGQIRAKANPDKCIQKMNPDWENGNPIHLWDCGVDKKNESWKKTIFAVDSSTNNANNPSPAKTVPVAPVSANDDSGSTCSGANQLTSAEIQEILRVHNAARAEVNVPPLKWNCKLADFAQDWVNRDAWGHSSSADRQKIIVGSYSGENLAGAAPSSNNIATTGPTGWWEEKAFWNSASASCQAGEVCGHYTQMVWRDTTEVGCGLNRKSSVMGGKWTQNSVYLSCVYNPGGNIGGKKPF